MRRDHRLLGVDDRLSSTCWIWWASAKTCGSPDGERRHDLDVREPLLVGAQRQRLADDLVEVDHRARGLPLAGKRQQVADDARGALGFAEDDVDAAPRCSVERLLGEPLGPAQDRRQRVVQLVRDAGNRLAERRHLFRLQQLLIEVARLVVQPLALADVADQRFDADRALRRRLGARGDLDPDGGAVHAAHAQQVVGDGAFGCQAMEEDGPGDGVGEALGRERRDVGVGRVGGVAEDRLEIGVCRQRRRRPRRRRQR